MKKKMTFNGSCNGCGKRGHEHKDCWLNESNDSERPHNWRNRARTLETNAPCTEDPPKIVLAIADNVDSIQVTDPEDNVCENYFNSEWKWDEDYFQKNNDSYDNANDIEPWSN